MEKKKLSQSEYKKLFRCAVNLYGVISHIDLCKVIKHYYPFINKEDLMANLMIAYKNKTKRHYRVIKLENDNLYLLVNGEISDEEMLQIYYEGMGIEFYLPSTINDFLNYQHDMNCDDKEDKYYSKFMYFIVDHYKNKEDDIKYANSFFLTSYIQFLLKIDKYDLDYLTMLKDHDFIFIDEESINELNKIWVKMDRYTRRYAYHGHNEIELKQYKRRNKEEMKRMVADKAMDLYRKGELKEEEIKNFIKMYSLASTSKEELEELLENSVNKNNFDA